MVQAPLDLKTFESLLQVVKALRDPNHGCPWDIEQTHQTLTPHMIEEAHELVEAIEGGSREHMIEELGDVLLQVVLHSEIGRQAGEFDILDVIEALNKKLVYRHSHVFGEVKANDAKSAVANWEAMKDKEKASRKKTDSFGVPPGLPSLQRAQKIGAKTRKFNFDWPNIQEVVKKVEEELEEVQEVLDLPVTDNDRLQAEIGDLLFSTAQLARHAELDAEACLREGNRRFEKRFFSMKRLAESRGQRLERLKPEELENLWSEVKKNDAD